jgi:hypothetical protein
MGFSLKKSSNEWLPLQLNAEIPKTNTAWDVTNIGSAQS